ncbi:SMI1/KNR4 family protein [Luteolibacter pohnpeiensis]|uniref:SMI1/KNR4 family protein n=1 Tax=Luteolibacter pohnpeiensis TaxID=454153 RepID=A0A934S871_9BACT|nr:SMI1/KNR4 family protein [Luteolibacter pohnpeiensis]MBK1884531.1 SMI1/KNR4 family protein [Luteolibacter pohnpeiensis]
MTVIQYIKALTDLGHPIAKHLRPGIPSSAASALEEELGIHLPLDIRELFMAFGGTEFQEGVLLGHGQLINGFHLMTIEEVRSEKEIMDGIVEDFPLIAEERHAFEGRNMLPFLADGLGNNVVVDVSKESKNFGAIGFFDHAGESLTDTFASFEKLIAAHFEALKSGVYSLSDEGYIQADYECLEKVLAKHQK